MKWQVIDRIERLEQTLCRDNSIHFEVKDNYQCIIYKKPYNIIYNPSQTGIKFHSSTSRVKHIMGAFGSGKSTICFMDIFIQATKMPPCKDGIRRMRVALVRNTAGEIETSLIKTWLLWFESIGTIKSRKKPNITIEHRFNDEKGVIELELIFLGLDKNKDLEKIKSTEFTCAYLNELSELPSNILGFMLSRVGRYPSRKMLEGDAADTGSIEWVPPYWYGINSDTNPPVIDHWLYKLFEILRPSNYTIFKQPPGLLKDKDNHWIKNEEADNLRYIGSNYYIDKVEGNSQEFIKVYCCGDYGILRTGKPVYPQYNDDLHSVDDIKIVPNEMIYYGIDFGTITPAFAIAQLVCGQLRIIKEFLGDNSALEELLTQSVIPWLNTHVDKMQYISTCDPADPASSTNNVTSRQLLEKYKIMTQKAHTNDPIVRVDTVKSFLNRMVSGKPAFILSRKGCPILRQGFIGDYNYKRVSVLNEERYFDSPNKIHPVSDIHDCVQYLCLRINYDSTPQEKIDISQFIDNSSMF